MSSETACDNMIGFLSGFFSYTGYPFVYSYGCNQYGKCRMEKKIQSGKHVFAHTL